MQNMTTKLLDDTDCIFVRSFCFKLHPMEERFLFSTAIRSIHEKTSNLLKANMKKRLALDTRFRAILTAKYVHFLQRSFYLLVPTSGAYTGRFLLAFNFHLQYNYYLTPCFFLEFNEAGRLGKKYLLLHSCNNNYLYLPSKLHSPESGFQGGPASDRIGICKCWLLRRGENQRTRKKTSRSRVKNQQPT